jgi:hypothetical protein
MRATAGPPRPGDGDRSSGHAGTGGAAGGAGPIRRPDGLRFSPALRVLRGAVNPLLGASLADFRQLVDGFAGRRSPGLVTAAVLGTGPGSGRSTVAAVVGLALCAHTELSATVVDAAGLSRGRSVGTLLAGMAQVGRMDQLLAVPPGEAVARSVVRAAGDPGTAVPVLEPPPGSGFPPQLLEQTAARLRYRTDVMLVDTPGSLTAPVQHAVLESVHHLILTAPADESAPTRVRQLLDWLATAPGRRIDHSVMVVLVGGRRRWATVELPVPSVWLRPSSALAAGRLAGVGRMETVAGLRIADVLVPGR